MKKLTNKGNHGSLLATWAYVRTRAAGTLC